MSKVRYVLCMVFVFSYSAIYGESVFLKTGSIIDGKIIKEDNKSVQVKLADGSSKELLRKDILRVLYDTDFKTKNYITKNDGTVVEAFIVDENRDDYTIRTNLNSSNETVIPKKEVDGISKKKPLLKNQAVNGAANDNFEGITDLMFIPSAGRMYFTPKFTYQKKNSDLIIKKEGESESTAKFETGKNDFSVSLGYGINDQISISLFESYSSLKETKNDVSIKSSGLTDPKLTFKVRGPASSLLADFMFSYSPKFFSCKEATQDKDGTLGKGGQSFGGKVELGVQTDHFSALIGVGGVYYTKQTVDTENGSKTKTGKNEIELYSTAQYIVGTNYLLRGGLRYFMQTSSTSKSSISETDYDAIHNIGATVGVGFVVIPDRTMLNIDGSYRKILDYKFKGTSSTGVITNTTNKNEKRVEVEIYMKFQF